MPNGVVNISGRLVRGGQPIEGAATRIVLNYKKNRQTIDGPPTGADGFARQVVKIPREAAGDKVDVEVLFLVNGEEVAVAQTSFRPQK
jgi:hypothetical protein